MTTPSASRPNLSISLPSSTDPSSSDAPQPTLTPSDTTISSKSRFGISTRRSTRNFFGLGSSPLSSAPPSPPDHSSSTLSAAPSSSNMATGTSTITIKQKQLGALHDLKRFLNHHIPHHHSHSSAHPINRIQNQSGINTLSGSTTGSSTTSNAVLSALATPSEPHEVPERQLRGSNFANLNHSELAAVLPVSLPPSDPSSAPTSTQASSSEDLSAAHGTAQSSSLKPGFFGRKDKDRSKERTPL